MSYTINEKPFGSRPGAERSAELTQVVNALSKQVSDLAKIVTDLSEQVSSNINHTGMLIEIVKNTKDRVAMFSNELYELFPEIDIVESIAETDEERRDMMQRYANANPDYTYTE